jgi:hypothetical protein
MEAIMSVGLTAEEKRFVLAMLEKQAAHPVDSSVGSMSGFDWWIIGLVVVLALFFFLRRHDRAQQRRSVPVHSDESAAWYVQEAERIEAQATYRLKQKELEEVERFIKDSWRK